MGKRTDYAPYDHFMLRAPLLPVEFLLTIPAAYNSLFPWLKQLWSDPLIREGVLLGSYEFSQRVDSEFLNHKGEMPDSSLMYSLLRYLCRFSSRCTPFGTFAGFSTGKIGSETKINLVQVQDHQLLTRPDMEYLMGIARVLEADPMIREKLNFSANTTLYRVGRRWHYVEVKLQSGRSRKIYDIVTVDDNGLIGDILEFCKNGRKLHEIRDYLKVGGWGEQEITDFVNSLVSSQIIVSGLEPVICGPEYVDCLIGELTADFADHPIVKTLVELKCLFNRMAGPSGVLTNLTGLDPILEKFQLPVNRNHLIQVDMKLGHKDLMVDAKLTGQVLLGLRIVRALSGSIKADPLKGFRDAFVKRYGERKVSLLKALDPETGIGLEGSGESYWTDPVPWIDDLRWGPSFQTSSVEGNSGNAWLIKKFVHVIRNNQQYLNLESSDLQAIGLHDGKWPFQLTALVELYSEKETGEAVIHVLMGSPGNPAYLLGRFGFADPGITREWIGQLIEEEKSEDSDMVFAEVVHLPEDRTGNILQRPSFLDYEIPYLARSVKVEEHQIPVTDLMIGIEDEKLILFSALSGKKIKPRMTNAYNHQLGNLAVYKFLHRFQLQDSSIAYQPDWGEAGRQASFIPGIRFKNMILSSPVWTIRCSEIAKWMHTDTNEVDIPELTVWRNGLNMPDEMVWVSSDQELYFSWVHANLLMALWDSIRKYPFIKVRPFYLSKGTPVISPDGSHANQAIFCYRKI